MRAWGKIEKGSIFTISTAHLDEAVSKALEDRYESGRDIDGDPNHWLNGMVWASFDYGYAVTGSSLLRRKAEHADDTPQCLLDIADMVEDHGADWIFFDQDALEVEGLQSFER